jgi:hypothetical protein
MTGRNRKFKFSFRPSEDKVVLVQVNASSVKGAMPKAIEVLTLNGFTAEETDLKYIVKRKG